MTQLRVTLVIELRPDVIEEEELDEEQVVEAVEEHLLQVIGPGLYEGRLIKEVYTESLGVS